MNDFTKEELEMIYNMMLNIRNEYPAIRKENDACCLKHKIQSMIDNYCKHETVDCNHEMNSKLAELPLSKTVCCGDDLVYTNLTWSIPKCHKCGRVLNEHK